jgi:hypothetical protein
MITGYNNKCFVFLNLLDNRFLSLAHESEELNEHRLKYLHGDSMRRKNAETRRCVEKCLRKRAEQYG